MKTTLTAANTQTRFVLAGAYRGRDIEARTMLTHLVRVEGGTAICRKSINMCDEYGSTEEQLRERPTCPKCAERWDRIHGTRRSCACGSNPHFASCPGEEP